jgi:hypothetical protein
MARSPFYPIHDVIPAKAGISIFGAEQIPAFAGMTLGSWRALP